MRFIQYELEEKVRSTLGSGSTVMQGTDLHLGFPLGLDRKKGRTLEIGYQEIESR